MRLEADVAEGDGSGGEALLLDRNRQYSALANERSQRRLPLDILRSPSAGGAEGTSR